MSQSYEEYMNQVVDEIDRVIELRRTRPFVRQVADHSYWGPPAPPTSLATAAGAGASAGDTTASKDESEAPKDFKINVRAEVHRINSRIKALSTKTIPETKPNMDAIQITPNDPDSEADKVDAVGPVVKFTIGDGDTDSAVVDADADQPSQSASVPIQVEEPNDEVEGNEREQRLLDFMTNGILVVLAILAIGLLAACFYEAFKASHF